MRIALLCVFPPPVGDTDPHRDRMARASSGWTASLPAARRKSQCRGFIAIPRQVGLTTPMA